MFSRIQLLTASTLLFATAAGAAAWKWIDAESRLALLKAELAYARAVERPTPPLRTQPPGSTVSTEHAPPPHRPPVALDSSPEDAPPAEKEEKDDDDRRSRRREFRVNARISTVEKFISLTDEQRKALAEMFDRDTPWREEPKEDERDEFAEIVGKENAQYYRSQMKQAFEQAEAESQEKEVLYMGKRLSLSAEQEAQVTSIMKEVSSTVRENMRAAAAADSSSSDKGGNSGGRIRRMIAESSMRQQLLNEQLQKIFTPEQYQLYLEQQAESTDGRFQVWHNE